MTSTRHQTDDDIRRWRAVWLGPRGWTWPWAATYLAWGLWLLFLIVIGLFELILQVPLHFPAWEVGLSALAATWVSTMVDHDRPVRMLPRTVLQHLRSPRPTTTRTQRHKPMAGRVRIKDHS